MRKIGRMAYSLRLRFLLLIVGCGISVPAFAVTLPENIAKFIEWETRHSPMSNARKSPEQVIVPTILVPEDQLQAIVQKKSDPTNLKALIVERDGKKYYRWLLHPDDAQYNGEIKEYIQRAIGPVIAGEPLLGYRTSSRTLVLFDAKTKHWFMAKMSCSRPGGQWQYHKYWTRSQGRRSGLVMTHLRRHNALGHQRTYGILQEPVSLLLGDGGVKSVPVKCTSCGRYHNRQTLYADYAISLRSMKRLGDPDTYFIPLFALFDREVMNFLGINTDDPTAVKEVIYRYAVKLRAGALAEFFHDSGLTFSSFHSQQFVLVAKKTARGFEIENKILMRDISDVEIWQDYFEKSDLGGNSFNSTLLAEFKKSEKIMKEVNVGEGLFRGWSDRIPFPQIGPDTIAEMQKRFYQEFLEALSDLSGIEAGLLFNRGKTIERSSNTQVIHYDFSGLQVTKPANRYTKSPSPRSCSKIFQPAA